MAVALRLRDTTRLPELARIGTLGARFGDCDVVVSRSVLVLIVAVAFGLGCGSGGDDGSGRSLVVQTASGAVQGFENDGVHSYRGIPYAAPPVGELRWTPPVEPSAWEDTRLAIEAGDICPQEAFGGLPIPGFAPSEDCLYLNVDAPAVGSRLPVMVWIHGGGFQLGEGLQADGGTAGDRIARQTGTIVVSMNYRLGQLGFLAHTSLTEESPDRASGNYGLMDQVAALRWVNQNIEAFGGDPDNVTIFGESAGAFSVCSHMVSPLAAGLFHRAILQSGSCQRRHWSLAEAERQGDRFAEALGCREAPEGVLACMRAAEPEAILAALPPASNFGFSPTDGDTGSWAPIVDGVFLSDQPSASFAVGDFQRVPTIVGFTKDEARLFVWLGAIADPPLEVTADSYVDQVSELLGGNAELAAEVAVAYPLSDYAEPAEALAAVATDAVFRCPAKAEAAKIAAFVPETYLYQFEYPNGFFQLVPILPLLGVTPPPYSLGAFHSADIPYVFGYDPRVDVTDLDAGPVQWEPGTVDERLWLGMSSYFTRFAETGDPNAAEAQVWPVYDAESDAHLAFDENVVAGTNVAEICDSFWVDKDYLVSVLGEGTTD